MVTCSFCDKATYALGLCGVHYSRYRRHGSAEITKKPRGALEDRFWPKVRVAGEDECWEWAACKSKAGYGVIQEAGRGSRLLLAHRVSFALANGQVPDGLNVLHSCDNPGCVNSKHLRAGTNQENIQEAYDKGRKVSPFTKSENRYRG